MTFEQLPGGGTVITGAVSIRFARLLACRSALKLEIKGLRRSGQSVGAMLKKEFGWKGSKAKLLEQLEAYIATQPHE